MVLINGQRLKDQISSTSLLFLAIGMTSVSSAGNAQQAILIGTTPEAPAIPTPAGTVTNQAGSKINNFLNKDRSNGDLPNSSMSEDDEIEGLVRVKGTSYTVKVQLTKKDEYKGHLLCSGETTRRIAKLSSFLVKASGAWTREGKAKCFSVANFTVTKTASGRLAVVGTIEKTQNLFQINADHGVSYRFDNIPEGLRELVGHRVILDVKTLGSRTDSEPSHRIVSYAKYP